MVHQSSKTILGEENPLYCVVSGHCLDYTYSWKHGASPVGENSPILWPDQVGMYTCRVSHGLKSCSSAVIEVVDDVSGRVKAGNILLSLILGLFSRRY